MKEREREREMYGVGEVKEDIYKEGRKRRGIG